MLGEAKARTMAELYLGVETGGTKLQVGLGTASGELLAVGRGRARAEDGAAAIRGQVLELIKDVLARAHVSKGELKSAGIGFGGPVDVERGTVTKSHQVSGREGFPPTDWLSGELGVPVVVHNDADTAGLAEAVIGAGRGKSPVFYIMVGSGIGGGLIIDGRIYRGCGPGASELGHLVVPQFCLGPDEQVDCTEGLERRVTVESIHSGWSIARRMCHRLHRLSAAGEAERPGPEQSRQAAEAMALANLAGGIELVTLESIGQAAAAGNLLAIEQLRATWKVLGWAIAQMIMLICPACVVIGGGVSLLGEELMFKPLREQVARMVFPPFVNSFSILPSSLGQSVVLHGAILLAASRAKSSSVGPAP